MPTVKDVDKAINQLASIMIDVAIDTGEGGNEAEQDSSFRDMLRLYLEIYDRLTHYKKMKFGDKR